MNRLNINDNYCCGCAACESICAQKAITMIENDHGFIVPRIDNNKCIDCGLCSKVCDFKKSKQVESNIRKAYSLIVKDPVTLRFSTSGGAFTGLSNPILDDGGVIIGAVLKDDFTVQHEIAYTYRDRDHMRGSKYVQSSIRGLYKTINDILKEGKRVLFTGSPCQCAAIKSYFRDKYKNLIVVDFLCHGVPSNKMFKEHIRCLENQYNKSIRHYSFRGKKYGWDAYSCNEVNFSDGTSESRWVNQSYYNFFVDNLSLREGCYNCPYRSYHRHSDITVADFWGIEKLMGRSDNNGISLVFVNSETGARLLQRAEDYCTIQEYDFEKVSYRIPLNPINKNKQYTEFWNLYKEGGYNALIFRFFDNSILKTIRFEIRKFAKKYNIC